MKRASNGFLSALSYFTILPLGPLARNVAPGPLAVAFLPFVGALIGAASGGIALLVSAHDRAWEPVLAWILLIVLSGAIHVDGFLDCCDALFASVPPQRRLEILHDPRHGTFAVTGMAVLTVCWIVAIAKIVPSHLMLSLAFAGTLARISAIANTLVFPYARPGAVTPAFATRPNPFVLTAGLALALVLGWFLSPMAFAIVPGAIALSLLLGWWASLRLGGGLTGDVFGGLIVSVEVVTLAVLAAI